MDIAGPNSWWDLSVFESLSIDTVYIEQIDDLSGAGNHLTERSANYPYYDPTGFNGLPGAVFVQNGIHDQQSIGIEEFDLSGETLMFFAAVKMSSQPDLSATSGSIVHYQNPGEFGFYDAFTVERVSTSDSIRAVRDGTPTTPNVTFSYDVPRRLIVTIETGGVMTVYLDGIAAATGTEDVSFTTGGNFKLGGRFGASVFNHYFAGAIGEAGLCTDANVDKVAELDDYLKNKWGM